MLLVSSFAARTEDKLQIPTNTESIEHGHICLCIHTNATCIGLRCQVIWPGRCEKLAPEGKHMLVKAIFVTDIILCICCDFFRLQISFGTRENPQ